MTRGRIRGHVDRFIHAPAAAPAPPSDSTLHETKGIIGSLPRPHRQTERLHSPSASRCFCRLVVICRSYCSLFFVLVVEIVFPCMLHVDHHLLRTLADPHPLQHIGGTHGKIILGRSVAMTRVKKCGLWLSDNNTQPHTHTHTHTHTHIHPHTPHSHTHIIAGS